MTTTLIGTTTVRVVNATEAKNRFGEMIKQAYHEEQPLIVQRDGILVVAILSVQEYERLLNAQQVTASAPEINPVETGLQRPLTPLRDLSEPELLALAEAVVAPARQRQLTAALKRQRNPGLSPAKRLALDDLLDKLLAEVDQVALLKARALYTLHLRQLAAAEAP